MGTKTIQEVIEAILDNPLPKYIYSEESGEERELEALVISYDPSEYFVGAVFFESEEICPLRYREKRMEYSAPIGSGFRWEFSNDEEGLSLSIKKFNQQLPDPEKQGIGFIRFHKLCNVN